MSRLSRLTKSAIEDFAIKLFERLGYDTIHASDIAPDGENVPPKLMSGEVRVAYEGMTS